MKKQILTFMISAAILSANPVFAMDPEVPEDGNPLALIPKKIPTKVTVDDYEDPIVNFIELGIQWAQWLTGYEDSETTQQRGE